MERGGGVSGMIERGGGGEISGGVRNDGERGKG